MVKTILDERASIIFQVRKGGLGAEIGVHEGAFAKRILEYAQPKKLLLVDPWQYQEQAPLSLYGGEKMNQAKMDARYRRVEKRFSTQISKGRVEIFRGTSQAALGEVLDDSLDFVYLDGDHRYEVVRQDLDGWLKKVKPGGLLLADDYRNSGWWGDDVIRACHEFIGKHNVEIFSKIGSQIAFKKH